MKSPCTEAPMSPKTAAVTCSAVRLACSPLSHPKQLQWHAFSLVKFVIWFWMFGCGDIIETTTQQQTHFQQNTLFSMLFFYTSCNTVRGVYWNHCGHLSVLSSCPSVCLSMCPASSRRYLLNTTTFFNQTCFSMISSAGHEQLLPHATPCRWLTECQRAAGEVRESPGVQSGSGSTGQGSPGATFLSWGCQDQGTLP